MFMNYGKTESVFSIGVNRIFYCFSDFYGLKCIEFVLKFFNCLAGF